SVPPPQAPPIEVKGRIAGDGVLGSEVFANINPEARLVVRMEHSAPHLGGTGKDLAQGVAEDGALLDSKIPGRKIEMDIGGVPDRRHVPRAMPGRAHPEEVAKGRDLPSHGDAAHLGNVAADEIDQAA